MHLGMPGLDEAVLKVDGQQSVLKSQLPSLAAVLHGNVGSGKKCRAGSQQT